jgi:nicotinamide-nucleotide amidase
MIGEIIAIGDELTSGKILNLTSNFAAHHLFAMGHEIVEMSTIGDSPELIGAAVKKALGRADFIITTGGLGPTSDDLTNEAVSNALNRPATFHPEILEKITQFFVKNNNTPGPNITLEKLAWLPAGAELLKPEGSMAGYLLIHDKKPIFLLPGVPHEMRELLVDCVLPKLRQLQVGEERHVRQRMYRVFGLSEAEINQKLKDLENDNSLIRLGYYPVFPEVHVSLTALGTDPAETQVLFDIFGRKIEHCLGDAIYGHDEETLAQKVGTLLLEQSCSIAVAESCTGGLISHLITTVPGSSAYFPGGVTAYSNQFKIDVLGVAPETLDTSGAVCAETAIQMARGVRKLSGAEVGLSVTGIAGPSGGTKEKPVGTVYIGLDFKGFCTNRLFTLPGERHNVQTRIAFTALDLLRRKLLEEKGPLG